MFLNALMIHTDMGVCRDGERLQRGLIAQVGVSGKTRFEMDKASLRVSEATEQIDFMLVDNGLSSGVVGE